MKKLTLEQVKERALQVGSEFLDDFYVDNSYKHNFKCAVCGETFQRSFNNVINPKNPSNKCLKCQPKNVKLSEIKFNQYKEEFKNNNKIEILTSYFDYKRNNVPLECRCLICNKIFYKTISNMQQGQMHGCVLIPEGERIVLDFCEKNGIVYKYQVKLENGLISDFEIYGNDFIIHLEIDGDQHYEYPNGFHKTYEEFLRNVENNKIKDKYYSDNGYINIHIRYQSNGKNNDDITKILNDIFKNKYGILLKKEVNENFSSIYDVRSNKASKKIICYDLEGNFIKIYESILDASKELGVNRATISDCLEGKYKRAKEYMFKPYEENYPLKIEKYSLNRNCKKVLCYNLDGSFKEIFNSISEASRKLNIDNTAIELSIVNENCRAGNYMFKEYSDDLELNIKAYNENKFGVVTYLNGKFYKNYESINKTHIDLNISRKKINETIQENSSIQGFTFKKIS
jgi:hypothetical protein